MQGRGAAVGDYHAPLFLAWQLTNRCTRRCLHCCEESGPDKTWPDELSRERSLELAREIVAMAIPYVAFGGGEPMGVPHALEVFDILTKGGVELKIETNGLDIGEKEADFLTSLNTACIQISIDGATAAVHEKLRPGSGYAPAWAAIDRLVKRGLEPELVFIPTKINVDDAAVGGNVVRAHPFNNLPPVFLALDAVAVCTDGRKEKALPFADMLKPEVMRQFGHSCILTEVRVPAETKSWSAASLRLASAARA